MKNQFNSLMIFAAGLGTRMLPLTNLKPKALVEIKGKPILYYSLEKALDFGFTNIIINTHYLASQIEESIKFFLQKNPQHLGKITLVYEEDLLETGGAVKNASKYFDSNVIFTLNSDSFIVHSSNIFQELSNSWRDYMRALMLLHKVQDAIGYNGNGDFFLQDNNEIRIAEGIKPFVYTGIQILNIDHVLRETSTKFSLSKFFQNNQDIYGLINPGQYYHLTNVNNIIDIEKNLIC